jgi:hypothetical protein
MRPNHHRARPRRSDGLLGIQQARPTTQIGVDTVEVTGSIPVSPTSTTVRLRQHPSWWPRWESETHITRRQTHHRPTRHRPRRQRTHHALGWPLSGTRSVRRTSWDGRRRRCGHGYPMPRLVPVGSPPVACYRKPPSRVGGATLSVVQVPETTAIATFLRARPARRRSGRKDRC